MLLAFVASPEGALARTRGNLSTFLPSVKPKMHKFVFKTATYFLARD
jgi:hypothetical protein